MKTLIVYDSLPRGEILAQLAEELVEAAKASLKLRRASDGQNPTPVSEQEAFNNLLEELADVTLCATVLFGGEFGDNDPRNLCDDVSDSIAETMLEKLNRWRERLEAREAPKNE